ncbi:MAG TPA: DUF2188 domain-containing protein [Stellaceae bacterium]|nr:DUF2188 domain-containing protein [Stellaceae bacterium]
MLGRHVYRVAPLRDGAWSVAKEGEAQPRGQRGSRQEAVEYACSLAVADQPSRVTVENEDGTIAEEKSYGADLAQQVRG